MAEYIEREALVQYIRSRKGNFIDDMGKGWSNGMEAAASACEKFPAADVEPVKRGCWSLWCDSRLDQSTGEYDEDFYLECSECKRKALDIDQSIAVSGQWGKLIEQFPYCHCGAKMDGERRETT